MTDATIRAEIEAALRGLGERVEHPRALVIGEGDRVALCQAIERVRAQLLGDADAVLTIALAGCSGAGKSTLINALADAPIAEATAERPCTMQTRVYHHRNVPAGGLPPELAARALFVAHTRDELRQKVIVDTPDLNTFATENREATRALLKAAGLVIYVFSPELYAEERAWSVIREEQRFSASLVVLNKSDTLLPAALDGITTDLRRRFAELNQPEMRILRICAAHHGATAAGVQESPDTLTVDEFAALRDFIELELRTGDIARMIAQQRTRVLDHLRDLVERAVGRDLPGRLARLEAASEERAAAMGTALSHELADQLATIDLELAPLAILRSHQRFWGPFRIWLSVADFLAYGLPMLVRRLRLTTRYESVSLVEEILGAGSITRVDDILEGEARKLQAVCYENQLPVDRWRAITGEGRAQPLLVALARRITSRFEAITALASRRNRFVVTLISVFGAVVPFALVIFGLHALLRNLIHGRIEGGLELLGVIVPLILLFDALLHSLVGLVDSGRVALSARGASLDDVMEVASRTLKTWTAAYRCDLEADMVDLRRPIDSIQAALDQAGHVGLDDPTDGNLPGFREVATTLVASDHTQTPLPSVAPGRNLSSRKSVAPESSDHEPGPPGPGDTPYRPLQRYKTRP